MRFSLTTMLTALFLIASVMGLLLYDNSVVLLSLPYSKLGPPQVSIDGKLAYYQDESGDNIVFNLREQREVFHLSAQPVMEGLRLSNDQQWLRIGDTDPIYADIIAKKLEEPPNMAKTAYYEHSARYQSDDGQIICGVRPDRQLVYRKHRWDWVQTVFSAIFTCAVLLLIRKIAEAGH